jgi:hypothetical protein
MPESRATRVLRIHIESTFRAPSDFAFRWCTDYSPEDPSIEKEDYTRWILSRSPQKVVYQDLGPHGRGWFLNQQTVTLRPPVSWHAESTGTYRTWSIDYRLRPRPDGTTQLTFDGLRRATALDPNPPSRAAVAENVRRLWSRFGRALENDYRRSRHRH